MLDFTEGWSWFVAGLGAVLAARAVLLVVVVAVAAGDAERRRNRA